LSRVGVAASNRCEFGINAAIKDHRVINVDSIGRSGDVTDRISEFHVDDQTDRRSTVCRMPSRLARSM